MIPAIPRVLRNYQTEDQREPFREWLLGLGDKKARAIIRNRLNRIQSGNFGKCEPVGEGVQELKIYYGPGYRVYFGVDDKVVILLWGSDKDAQQQAIRIARDFWRDYNA